MSQKQISTYKILEKRANEKTWTVIKPNGLTYIFDQNCNLRKELKNIGLSSNYFRIKKRKMKHGETRTLKNGTILKKKDISNFKFKLTKEYSYLIGLGQTDGHLAEGTRNRGKVFYFIKI